MSGFKIIGYDDHEECWIDCDGEWKLFSDIKNGSSNKRMHRRKS
jgi:hypothetical protein